MRTLNNIELNQINKSIALKELTSAEILLEIYDHYISHLENFSEDEFEEQLDELDHKFTYAYCHSMQAKFLKASKKEIFNLQWTIFKSYFSWPRLLLTLAFLVFLLTLWGNIENRTKAISLVIPLVFILCLNGWIWFQSYKKVRDIKKLINAQNRIESSYLSNILVQFSLMTSLFNLLILVPKILDVPNFMESHFFLIATFGLFILYTGYTLTLFEAWKFKSKSSLI